MQWENIAEMEIAPYIASGNHVKQLDTQHLLEIWTILNSLWWNVMSFNHTTQLWVCLGELLKDIDILTMSVFIGKYFTIIYVQYIVQLMKEQLAHDCSRWPYM